MQYSPRAIVHHLPIHKTKHYANGEVEYVRAEAEDTLAYAVGDVRAPLETLHRGVRRQEVRCDGLECAWVPIVVERYAPYIVV
ncbi:hypothetical protein BS47DRAFT_1348486 [Hydnum rufescens UP504]|uniref:Uncharacterized protein n=1 Tax=Hydnum rufescens UP504 TaxID=1448309 RepID=A0A9P6DT10_9AGAM|nr:hypothetical protein BS47DRAFT_1348486 [Hydnum rufescens UP504]